MSSDHASKPGVDGATAPAAAALAPIAAPGLATEPAAAGATAAGATATSGARGATRVYRHRLPVRIMHWVNVACLTILLMSGLNIFNAHPALYWGRESTFAEPWISFRADDTPQGSIGVTRIGSREFVTTGVFGLSDVDGRPTARAFPGWATIPTTQWLAMARHWHFFFAWLFAVNGVCYVLYALFSGHLRRDLVPTGAELRRIGASVLDHLRFRHPVGDEAKRYNVLQNLAYLSVIFVLLPLVIVAGLAMSPRLDAAWAGWVDLLGGRQSARTLHFLAALGLLLFVCIHVFEVVISGVCNQLRSMVTGWYTLPVEHKPEKRP